MGPNYYLAGSAFSLEAGLDLLDLDTLAGVLEVLEGDWRVAPCEALRRMGATVLGASTGTVGARTDSGCRDGQTL